MRDILNRFAIVAVAAFALSSCINHDEGNDIVVGGGGTSSAPSTIITPACRVESQSVSRARELGITVRSLIDQITTKQLDSNFLRIDEDQEYNDGLYTFKGGVNTPLHTNWNKAYTLEATIISSPDNTENIHYRSVSLTPVQQYKMNIVEHKDANGDVIADTTHFYHTRLVGWYPKNCKLPEREGAPATPLFGEWSEFDAVRINETVNINGVPTEIVGLHFKNFNGETDIMVSDVCEAQAWHKYNPNNPHKSDVHPTDGKTKIYREPFGHNFENPAYSNFLTYRHYRSAIRVSAYADQSEQSLSMWGEIEDVIIRNQPTSCKIWLPTEVGKFGEVYEWGDYKNQNIVRTAMFGNDSNHPEYHEEAKYPISMKGSSLRNNIYLGYSLIEPGRDVELEVHTQSGVYTTVISADHIHTHENGTEEHINLFERGYIYHITLNLQTSGTISAILEKEGDEHYYDLSRLHKYEVDNESGSTGNNSIEVFKIANCYIIDPTSEHLVLKDENGNNIKDENGNNIPYDGYCFLATIIGNGQAGIISQGSQTLYPDHEDISPMSAHLLWESELGLITNVELKFGYVRFKVPKGKAARGNAVIAVYDEKENILWSWHIWITESPQEVEIELGEGEHHTITVLDRNLGATRATCTNGEQALETYGLYYQWGRKDPSMGPKSYDYSILNLITAPYYDYSSDKKTAAEVAQFARPTLQNAIENPMYLILPSAQTSQYSFNWLYERYDFLWGYNIATGMTSKTIYDPCPYGYRVPSSELNHLFTSDSGTGQAGTYGYTRTFNGTTLFFPYAGYKGVDVGLSSVALPWKYVGEKGDYQSSMYCMVTDDMIGEITHYMHRERIYISKEQSWEELNVGTYNAYMTPCYANRRTAAPVRCVKDEMIGSITGSISVDTNTFVAGALVNISYNAHSYGSAIENVVIHAEYTTTNGVNMVREVRKENGIRKYNIEGAVPFNLPEDCDDNGITFKLIVENEHGLTHSDDTELTKTSIKSVFMQWNDRNIDSINSSNRDYVIVGQPIRYYVGVLASAKPTEVTINGENATELTDYNVVPQPSGSATSKTVWYIDWTPTTKDTYDMTVVATVDGMTDTREVGSVKVAGISNTAATSLDTTGNTLYVVEATRTTGYYLTTQGNNLAASNTWGYYSVVSIEDKKIKSFAKNLYFNGNNGNITFNATGTEYTITINGSNVTMSNGNNYIRQRSTATEVQISNSSSGRNWVFYPITLN